MTDDGPRRLRGVWLGPKGLRWPVDWTYTQWGVFTGLLLVCPPIVFSVFYFVNLYLAICNAILWSPFLAYSMTRLVMAHTDYDRPLRFWARQVPGEFKRSRRTPAAAQVRIDCGQIVVHDLASTVEHHYLPATRRQKGGSHAHPSAGQSWPSLRR